MTSESPVNQNQQRTSGNLTLATCNLCLSTLPPDWHFDFQIKCRIYFHPKRGFEQQKNNWIFLTPKLFNGHSPITLFPSTQFSIAGCCIFSTSFFSSDCGGSQWLVDKRSLWQHEFVGIFHNILILSLYILGFSYLAIIKMTRIKILKDLISVVWV